MLLRGIVRCEELRPDPVAQLVRRERRRVEHDVGVVLQHLEQLTFARDAVLDALRRRERVRTSLLFVAADERLVRRLEEQDVDVGPLLAQPDERVTELLEELLEELTAARPDDDRRAVDTGRAAEVGDLLDDRRRQVVHHEVAHVLEGLRRLGHPRARTGRR